MNMKFSTITLALLFSMQLAPHDTKSSYDTPLMKNHYIHLEINKANIKSDALDAFLAGLIQHCQQEKIDASNGLCKLAQRTKNEIEKKNLQLKLQEKEIIDAGEKLSRLLQPALSLMQKNSTSDNAPLIAFLVKNAVSNSVCPGFTFTSLEDNKNISPDQCKYAFYAVLYALDKEFENMNTQLKNAFSK